MTSTTPLAQADPSSLSETLRPHAAALKSIGAECDAMCLTAGLQLGDAVPSLYDLASQVSALSDTLLQEGGEQPTHKLEGVAQHVLTIGGALAAERETIGVLINLNELLARRILSLSEAVRFLTAVVSNVKIEIASLGEEEHRLEGFADNLKRLACKSETTVTAFDTAHQTLIKQLRKTAAAQFSFVTSHGAKFSNASQEISTSLVAVSARRRQIAAVASDVGTISQGVGAKIAECVMTLQNGDSTRQRLEHAGDALMLAADIAAGLDSHQAPEEAIGDDHVLRDLVVARISLLATTQSGAAAAEFSDEVTQAVRSIEQLTDAVATLDDKSRAFVTDSGNGSTSFLAELEAKLASASGLIEECGRSRLLVDETAGKVIDTVVQLQDLAKSVADMAVDMMIIGTNAIVTSFRLGTKGAALSVIAQHLRNHAVQVTDAVGHVCPALDKVFDAAKTFTSIRDGQDAESMGGLALRIAEALAAFQDGDRAVAAVRAKLDAEVVRVGDVLSDASSALGGIGPLAARLQALTTQIEELVPTMFTAPIDDRALPASLDRLLRSFYTMGSERVLHDKVLSLASPDRAEALDEAIWA